MNLNLVGAVVMSTNQADAIGDTTVKAIEVAISAEDDRRALMR